MPQLHACLANIPYDAIIAANTIAAVKSYLELYPFFDMNMNSGPPFNLQVDIMAELDAITSTTYVSDYDFHMAVRLATVKCHDGHFQYLLPSGYQLFVVIQPL